MTYRFIENEGLITVIINGKLPTPFMYIDARTSPPWWVEPVGAARVGPFQTLEAAKFGLLMALNQGESK